jgi:hypothetical protein
MPYKIVYTRNSLEFMAGVKTSETIDLPSSSKLSIDDS